MHLLAPLASGMRGAESGTVEVYARGTSTPITLYTDFEGTVTTANPATLDANGRAKLYVDQYARCLVKDNGGATVIDFVDGYDANGVELRSASIIGNAYVGGAAAAGNPISVEAAINRLVTSFGSTDFNVLLAGVSTTLQAALGALWRARVFDVKQYGALGDGATNDLSAINAAFSAANAAGGGVVFFPPGTYNVSATITTFATTYAAGVSSTASVIRMTADARTFSAAAPMLKGISRLGFAFTVVTYTGYVTMSAGAGDLLIEECAFQNATGTSAAILNFSTATLTMVSCTAGISTAAGTCVMVLAGAKAILDKCTFIAFFSSGYGVHVGSNTGGGITPSFAKITSCKFDFSANTGGQTTNCIRMQSAATVIAVGNEFVPGNHASAAQQVFFRDPGALDGALVEYGNDLSLFLADLLSTATLRTIYSAAALSGDMRGSRAELVRAVDTPNATIYLAIGQVGVAHVFTTAGAGTRLVSANQNSSFTDAPPDGTTAVINVHNDTGSSITYQWSSGFAASGTTFAVAANSIRCFHVVYITARSEWFPIGDAAGAETAE